VACSVTWWDKSHSAGGDQCSTFSRRICGRAAVGQRSGAGGLTLGLGSAVPPRMTRCRESRRSQTAPISSRRRCVCLPNELPAQQQGMLSVNGAAVPARCTRAPTEMGYLFAARYGSTAWAQHDYLSARGAMVHLDGPIIDRRPSLFRPATCSLGRAPPRTTGWDRRWTRTAMRRRVMRSSHRHATPSASSP